MSSSYVEIEFNEDGDPINVPEGIRILVRQQSA